MPALDLSDCKFFRMWPRKVFRTKDSKKRLLIKTNVPDLKHPGVYVLYRGDELYYIGRAQNLFSRLHDHANKIADRYYPHWNYFSAFAVTSANGNQQKIAELEAILIAAMPRATNKSTPRFKKVRIPKALLVDQDQEQ
ncbi:GIY-YIG nuclease family protein [Alloacidobacterium dinghuense]|uniref:GIY-YIG nuclease family protein n=1 Tax=Alloacidobacterium dinghuense TaxID=2763107 RepID=A0A7G8BFA8_9BACT|nr:GIY-YIG nuclease family protein [Alloacidobacterium dinghuense]QNI31228.1 GIY-YIG nuclease family protein [Alloacidobacterium dinghuense]